MSQYHEDTLNLRGTPCPMNFVRIKLELDKLPAGSVLNVTADGGVTGRDILSSLEQQSYSVSDLTEYEHYIMFKVSNPPE